MLRLFLTTGFSLLIAAALIFILVWLTLFSPARTDQGTLHSELISEAVTLERMSDGHSRIAASSRDDLWFALGFTHARNRLWQLQRMKWAANQAYSRHFGEVFLPADKLSLLITKMNAAQPDPAMEKYAAGINAFIKKTGSSYPVQFTISGTRPETWSAEDAARVAALQHWLLDTGWQQPLANRLASEYIPEGLLPFFFDDADFTSGSQVFGGISASEQITEFLRADALLRELLHAPRALPAVRELAVDSNAHLLTYQSAAATPSFWYDVTLESPGNTPAQVFTIPGSPVLWSGSTDGFSWFPDFGDERLPDVLNAQQADDSRPKNFLISKKDGEEIRFRAYLTDTHFSFGDPDEALYFPIEPASTEALSRFSGSVLSGRAERGNLPNPLKVAGSMEISDSPLTLSSGDAQILLTGEGTEDNAYLIGEKRLDKALKLATILGELPDEHEFSTIIEYLTNWNGNYGRYSVAASLMETTILMISENALRNYLPAEVFTEYRRMGLIDTRIGENLIGNHYRVRGPAGGSSPVTDGFMGRRVMEAVENLQATTGEASLTWRWGNLNSIVFTDPLLCGGSFLFSVERNRACRNISRNNPVALPGNRDLASASFSVLYDDDFRPLTFTSGYLMISGEADGTRSRLIPGYSADPFSRFFHFDAQPKALSEAADAEPSHRKTNSRFTLRPR